MSARAGVVVLGMHRSGTTAVTRTINLMGVPTSAEEDLAPGWVGNPAGHWESLTVMRTNDELLRTVGAAWWCPPPVDERLWSSPRIERLRPAARAGFRASHTTDQWVTKDPRLCVTFPFWRKTLDEPLVVVLVTRHPLEVAASLETRDALPIAFGLGLWERYMHHALRSVVGLPVFVTRYDELLEGPTAWIDKAGAFLGAHSVAVGHADPTGVVDPALKHEAARVAVMSDEQQELASVVGGLASSSSFELPVLPGETPTTGPMFERLRRRRGVGRRWRWRRYLNRDRNGVVVGARDLPGYSQSRRTFG
jgi:hypothetical protein